MEVKIGEIIRKYGEGIGEGGEMSDGKIPLVLLVQPRGASTRVER